MIRYYKLQKRKNGQWVDQTDETGLIIKLSVHDNMAAWMNTACSNFYRWTRA